MSAVPMSAAPSDEPILIPPGLPLSPYPPGPYPPGPPEFPDEPNAEPRPLPNPDPKSPNPDPKSPNPDPRPLRLPRPVEPMPIAPIPIPEPKPLLEPLAPRDDGFDFADSYLCLCCCAFVLLS